VDRHQEVFFMLSRVFPFVMLVVVALVSVAQAETIVVKPGGPGETPIADAVALLQDDFKLVIKKGVYPERLVLTGLNGVMIVGKGNPRIGDGGALDQIQAVNCTNVTLQGLVVVEGESNGILISSSNGSVVKRCTVESPAQVGIRVLNSDDVVIEKCRVGGTAATAGEHAGIVSSESDRLLVTRCRLDPGLDDGVQVVDGIDVEIVKNRFRGILDRGVFFQVPKLLCDRNRFTDCEGGVRSGTAAAGECVISRNRMSGIGISGGVFIFTPGVTVTGNRINDADGLGIGNTFLAEGIEISNNRVRDARMGGIVNNASNSTVTGNRVTKATDEGIAARGTDATYEGNVIKKTNGDGILVTRGGNTFRDNKVSGSTESDLRSQVAQDQNTFEDNRFGVERYP
jgi:nitrous oxidase accessory protein NosD